MGKIKIDLKRSLIGCSKKQKAVIKGLGLRYINHSVVREDSVQLRGMIEKIPHMLQVSELSGQ